MRTITKKYNIYNYNELSENAKETVKQWYLDDYSRSREFFDGCMNDLRNIFPDSDLKVQYSLNSCQGDGVNICGMLNVNNIISFPSSHFCGDKFNDLLDYFTDKEIRTLINYSGECGDIKLPENRSYWYCCVDNIDLAAEWTEELEWSCYRNINIKLLEKFQKYVIKIIKRLCSDYEKQGYKHLYEIEDDELNDFCEANKFTFLEDGTLFCA